MEDRDLPRAGHLKGRLQAALEAASKLEELTLLERLRTYSFLKRYTGKWHQPDSTRGGPDLRKQRLETETEEEEVDKEEESDEDFHQSPVRKKGRRRGRVVLRGRMLAPASDALSSTSSESEDDSTTYQKLTSTRPKSAEPIPSTSKTVRKRHPSKKQVQSAKEKKKTVENENQIKEVVVHFKPDDRDEACPYSWTVRYPQPPTSAKLLVILAVQNLTKERLQNDDEKQGKSPGITASEVREFLSGTFPYFQDKGEVLDKLVHRLLGSDGGGDGDVDRVVGGVSQEVLQGAAPALRLLRSRDKRSALAQSMARPHTLERIVANCLVGQEEEMGFEDPPLPFRSALAVAALLEAKCQRRRRGGRTKGEKEVVPFSKVKEGLASIFPFYEAKVSKEVIQPGSLEVSSPGALANALFTCKEEFDALPNTRVTHSVPLLDEALSALLNTLPRVEGMELLTGGERVNEAIVPRIRKRISVSAIDQVVEVSQEVELSTSAASDAVGSATPSPVLGEPSMRTLIEISSGSSGRESAAPSPSLEVLGAQVEENERTGGEEGNFDEMAPLVKLEELRSRPSLIKARKRRRSSKSKQQGNEEALRIQTPPCPAELGPSTSSGLPDSVVPVVYRKKRKVCGNFLVRISTNIF